MVGLRFRWNQEFTCYQKTNFDIIYDITVFHYRLVSYGRKHDHQQQWRTSILLCVSPKGNQPSLSAFEKTSAKDDDGAFLIQVSSPKVRKQVRRQGTIVCWAQVGSHPLWAGPGVTQWEESHSWEKGVQEGPEEGGGSSSQKKVSWEEKIGVKK